MLSCATVTYEPPNLSSLTQKSLYLILYDQHGLAEQTVTLLHITHSGTQAEKGSPSGTLLVAIIAGVVRENFKFPLLCFSPKWHSPLVRLITWPSPKYKVVENIEKHTDIQWAITLPHIQWASLVLQLHKQMLSCHLNWHHLCTLNWPLILFPSKPVYFTLNIYFPPQNCLPSSLPCLSI